MERYRSLSQELRKTYGMKVYRLALDGGMTCPNRDGTLGTRGCIFCSGDGSGTFAQSGGSVTEQIEQAKKRVAAKTKGGPYIAYFQSFTNTYAPLSYLEKLFREAIAHPEVVILSIATRPDCLQPEVLDLLEALNRIKPVWVELGLQTIHEKTARYIRRGYALTVYDQAVEALQRRKLKVITHVILGLPGENLTEMLETVRYAGERSSGIKLQLLHVLKGTDLETEYREGKVCLPGPEEYCRWVADCIRSLPPHVVIHRLTGDGAKKDLAAPLWSGDKKRVLNAINRYLEEAQVFQGQWYRSSRLENTH